MDIFNTQRNEEKAYTTYTFIIPDTLLEKLKFDKLDQCVLNVAHTSPNHFAMSLEIILRRYREQQLTHKEG